VTAKGGIDGSVTESYRRAGDVIELYVWGGPADSSVQLVDLPNETPSQLTSPWQISAPLDSQVESQSGASPIYCNVALQSTHAFMLAGSAGG
jgi:hypothetical protein